jgi:hypothetical protein
VTPPPLPESHHKSLIQEHVYTYGFSGSWTGLEQQQQGIVDAFQAWNEANLIPGLNVSFVPVVAGATPDIPLQRDLLVRGVAAQFDWQAGPKAPDGHMRGGPIVYSTATLVLSSRKGYYRVTLHELGHALGMDHALGHNGSSVMNTLTQKNDGGNDIPDAPTVCDRDAAKLYSLR